MTRTIRRSFPGLLMLLALARPAASQSSPVSLTVGAGVAHGGGGDATLRERNTPMLSGLLTVRSSPGSRVILGLAAGVEGFGDISDVCDLRPDGACAQAYPSFAHLAALGGLELTSDGGVMLRVMAGPGFVLGGPASALAGSNRVALAVHALADISTPPLWHFALVASTQSTLVPDYRGNGYRVSSFGLGLRLAP